MDRESAYDEAIATVRRRHKQELMVLSTANPPIDCFARLWKNEDSTRCEQRHTCAVSLRCEEAHREATLLQLPTRPRRRVEHVAPPPPPPVVEPVKRTQRQRYAGQAHSRHRHVAIPYKTAGRPVDAALTRFVATLGNPVVLPLGWQASDLASYGRIAISQTMSFTSVLVDGEMIARVWVNAASCAGVDMVRDLALTVMRDTNSIVHAIPKGSQHKSKPCTSRVTVGLWNDDDVDEIDAIARVIVEYYELEKV